MIKYHVSVVQEKTTILWCSYIILAYVDDKHFRSFFCRQNAMDLGEREEREVKD